jgi:hypothetical protein
MVSDHPELDKASDKAVMYALKIFMDNETGKCYPTEKQIAAKASVTDRTARKSLQKAESLRILDRKLSKPKSGRGYPNYVYYPRIPGENISAINNKPQEIKTKPQEINSQNHGKSFPPNYSYNYTNNYDNSFNKQEVLEQKQLDPNEKTITIYDRGRELTIGESQVKSKKDCLYILKNIQNGIEQKKVIDWFIDNNLSEIKTRDELNSSKQPPDISTAESL